MIEYLTKMDIVFINNSTFFQKFLLKLMSFQSRFERTNSKLAYETYFFA
jgi:hypothetical protein